MLVFSALKRYEAFLRNYPELVSRLPLYEIASYLGITPVALSNVRKKLRAQ